MGRFFGNIIGILFLVIFTRNGFAQISPGELSKAHAHLEGLTNCTKCHVLGEKETTSKCLECHQEIKNLISEKKGYHASSEVKGKKCAECHGEHFGLDFKLVRFDENSFKHDITGYKLEGKHNELKCTDCHKPELIHTKLSQKKGDTYLGLGTDCLSCHDDFHQNTLSKNCINCHNQEKFRPAPLFNHTKTDFPLVGKHSSADCAKCHKIEQRNGKEYQQFSGVAFANCTSCHEDVHKNKFGINAGNATLNFHFMK
ncbi:MAG: cytochrome c3 family protein [Draconibacterium sp.]